MKHLLTAALIAIALASPVRGEETHLSCVNTVENILPFSLTINTSTWSATYKDELREVRAEILFVDPYGGPVTWLVNTARTENAYYPYVIVLQRSTLRAATMPVNSGFMLSPDPGVNVPRSYQCIRPL